MKIYVDDLNQVGLRLPYGSIFRKGKLYIPGEGWKGRATKGQAMSKEEKEALETEANLLALEDRTIAQEEAASARIYREVANSILPSSVRMKEDVPSNHPSGAIPILDTEMWIESGRIYHSHYSKPMASKEVILERSAMSTSSKVNILVQEGARRLRNCSLDLSWDKVVSYLNNLMTSMYWGGYSTSQRTLVATRILARHQNNLTNLEEQGRPLYRDKETRMRLVKEDKGSWFRKLGATATIMVPTTPGSSLAKGIREILKKHGGPVGTSTKVVERPGRAIHSNITSNNPFPRKSCGRSGCPYARSGKDCLEKCSKESIVYEAQCLKCNQDQSPKQVYFGESSRTLFTRSNQHLEDFKKAVKQCSNQPGHLNRDECSSWIMDHAMGAHGGHQNIDPTEDIQFSVRRQQRDPLTRQINESVIIHWGLEKKVAFGPRDVPEVINCLNRKEECFVPRVRKF